MMAELSEEVVAQRLGVFDEIGAGADKGGVCGGVRRCEVVSERAPLEREEGG
jgi:hypothetical protein